MNVKIAQRLADLRRQKGYSQESLANALGLSRQAVSKWERAESSPDTDNLIALARLYGVSLDDLLNIDKDIEDDVSFEDAERTKRRAEEEQHRGREEANSQAAAEAAQAAAEASRAAAQAAAAATHASRQATRASEHIAHAEAQGGARKQKGAWRSFPYGILMIPLWFVLTIFGAAPFSFLVFFTIPVYHWLANIMDAAQARADAEASMYSGDVEGEE